MSANYPAATLAAGRQIIRNGIAEIQHLTRGDLPQAFGQARQYCLDMAEACRVCELELAGHAAANQKCPVIPTETPEEAEELDRIEAAHPQPNLHPAFETLVAPFRRPA